MKNLGKKLAEEQAKNDEHLAENDEQQVKIDELVKRENDTNSTI